MEVTGVFLGYQQIFKENIGSQQCLKKASFLITRYSVRVLEKTAASVKYSNTNIVFSSRPKYYSADILVSAFHVVVLQVLRFSCAAPKRYFWMHLVIGGQVNAKRLPLVR